MTISRKSRPCLCGKIADSNFCPGEVNVKNTRLLIVSILALVLFGTCIFFLRDLIFGGVVGTYEEAQPNMSEYRDKWITYEVTACLGEYAEETETQYFIPTGHTYYYVIWMADGSLMPLSVSKKADREYLDALTDATYDYIDGKTKRIEMEPRTFTGTIKNQESEARGYYDDLLSYWQATEADGYTVRYELMDCSESKGLYIFFASFAMLIPLGGIAIYIVNVRKEKGKKVSPEQEYLPR